ncbi:MAG: imidazole glycerol phosphate synthase subunit HisH [Rickettsiales bacterium TMED254]|nr:imidazole glycerol phosphate synthase subunit HisH [Rickettsiales bacterium]RPF76263.1 MAG: imidazole glycerol phosphate synthase subunit HisH [Rickettsiales bacterium TMED254]|tara:strand:+ start:134 stop:805 length:672 start_codon:yes stop_codon:yes gene_type:complete
MSLVSIIDYGSGNLRSVFNAVKNVISKKTNCRKVIVTNEPSEILKSSHIILPGVGSFKSCLNGVYNSPGLFEAIQENTIVKLKPFLGICVGMQMMANKGFEEGERNGFGWIEGDVKLIRPELKSLKIPHIGWNNLKIEKKHKFIDLILKNKKFYNKEINAYFVHSYAFELKNKENEILSTDYGKNITAMIGKSNILGTQFHPEKSQMFGLSFLKAFLMWEGQE